MADPVKYPGRLIAIDGTRGKDVTYTADVVAAELKARGIDCAVSRFDASGLFGELAAAGRGERTVSIRTLTLVYAADLAFRLRWEIHPALDAGNIVIAAPYVDSAVATGAAYGLDERWIRDLLGFAPQPNVRVRAEEKKIAKDWKARRNRGYGEYCAFMLRGSPATKKGNQARREAIALLGAPGGRKIYGLGDDSVDKLTRAIIGSPAAKRRRAASKPRNGRS